MTERTALRAVWLCLFVLLSFGGCDDPSDRPTQAGTVWFEETAAASGLEFTHMSARDDHLWIPEINVGGVGLIDIDNDDDLDVYLIQGGDLAKTDQPDPGNQLFVNSGDGTFVDRTESAGVGDTGYGNGCAVGDYDRDGFVDLYVTNLGANVLYHNNGDGTFSNVTTTAGVGHDGWSSSSTFVDINNDGWLDLYVVNYLHWSRERELECYMGGRRDYCSPSSYKAPAADVLYRNRKDGTFEDVSVSSGITRSFGNGLGVVAADFNNDGAVDIFVANDRMDNQLWVNNGNGSFEDQALIGGCALNRQGIAEAGMGVARSDIDHDGDIDFLVCHMAAETNTLYLNNGGWFDDDSARSGLGMPSLRFTAWGPAFADFNHDGYEDLYISNGRVISGSLIAGSRDPYAESNLLFAGSADGHFELTAQRGGTNQLLVHSSRAVAVGDLTGDGAPDLVVANRNATPYLLKNRIGHQGNWMMVRLVDIEGIDVYGAMIGAESSEGWQWRLAHPGHGYCASHDPRVHFGLGNNRSARIVVRLMGGQEKDFGILESGRIHRLVVDRQLN